MESGQCKDRQRGQVCMCVSLKASSVSTKVHVDTASHYISSLTLISSHHNTLSSTCPSTRTHHYSKDSSDPARPDDPRNQANNEDQSCQMSTRIGSPYLKSTRLLRLKEWIHRWEGRRSGMTGFKISRPQLKSCRRRVSVPPLIKRH
jgi:hypothetical protein